MSTPNNPFEQIILPTQIPSAWPPAPIYWLIALLVMAVIGVCTYFIKRHIKQQARVKQALAQLNVLQNEKSSFVELNRLLKGIMLSYYPRSEVASLSGKAWFDFLQNHYPHSTPIFNDLTTFEQRIYHDASMANEQDFSSVKQYITGLPKQMSALQKEQQAGIKNA